MEELVFLVFFQKISVFSVTVLWFFHFLLTIVKKIELSLGLKTC